MKKGTKKKVVWSWLKKRLMQLHHSSYVLQQTQYCNNCSTKWDASSAKKFLSHDFCQQQKHIAGNSSHLTSCWSKVDKGTFCLSWDYIQHLNNSVYTCINVLKHRLQNWVNTNRYLQMEGSPGCIKRRFTLRILGYQPQSNFIWMSVMRFTLSFSYTSLGRL